MNRLWVTLGLLCMLNLNGMQNPSPQTSDHFFEQERQDQYQGKRERFRNVYTYTAMYMPPHYKGPFPDSHSSPSSSPEDSLYTQCP